MLHEIKLKAARERERQLEPGAGDRMRNFLPYMKEKNRG
jgi:hypothetical protein